MLFHWAIQTKDMKWECIPHSICNTFECKFKSCPRDSLHILWKKFILNINLELILHYISRGVKRIPPNVQTNISNLYTKLTVSSLITEWNWNNEFRPKEEVGGKAREKTSYQLFNISCFSNQSSATTLWLSLDSWQPSQKWPRLLAALNVANLQKSSSHPSSSTVGIFRL